MNAALAKAIELLERHSPGRFDVWALAGPSGRKARAALMETLLGHRLPQAKCGVNALQAEFYRQAGIVGDCPAHRQAKFAEFCKLTRAFKGTILARRMGDFYEFTGSYAQEAAEALGRKAVFTKQRGEIDPQWHFGVPYHERGRLEDALLAKGCLLSVPGESAPEAIATPMAPSPIEATLFPPEAPSVAPVAPQVPPATTEGVVVVEKHGRGCGMTTPSQGPRASLAGLCRSGILASKPNSTASMNALSGRRSPKASPSRPKSWPTTQT